MLVFAPITVCLHDYLHSWTAYTERKFTTISSQSLLFGFVFCRKMGMLPTLTSRTTSVSKMYVTDFQHLAIYLQVEHQQHKVKSGQQK